MSKINTLAILGASGKTGQFVVSKFLRLNYELRLLLRKPDNFKIHSDLIEIVQGDATDPESVDELLSGCTAVISTLGQRRGEPLVATAATMNLVRGMEKNGIRRFIFLAGINIDTPFDNKGPATISATDWMKANYPEIQEDRQKAYSYLTKCDIDWTMVRVPLIEHVDGDRIYKVEESDCPGTSIAAGDIADFIIGQLSDQRYIKKAPFIAN
jgi:putative NADH-flavin reductase